MAIGITLIFLKKENKSEKKEVETNRVKRIKSIAEKIEKKKSENREKLKEWDPKKDEKIQGDAYKTLFVYKLNYETNEKKLKKEFEIYGPVKRIRIVKDSNGKSRGYAFIEYEHKSDFKTAYKRAEMKRIDNNRVRVDFERGRTDSSFKPRYLGGGKGETRRITKWVEKEIKAIKESYPEIANKYRKNEMLSRKRSRSISRSEEEKKHNSKEENKSSKSN